MASTSETGHAKNIANFSELVTRTNAFGAAYNPAKTALQQAQLETQLQAAQSGLTALATAKAIYADMVDKREAIYGPLPKLITRTLNLFRSSVSNKAQIDTAQHLADLMRGFMSKKPAAKSPDPADPTAKSISTSRQSYDSIYENMEQFIEVLAANPAYAPNEAEFSVNSLRALLAEMKAINDSADTIETVLDGARGLRNTQLYANESGLVDTALAVKQYVKGVFTKENVQCKAISKLAFKRVQ